MDHLIAEDVIVDHAAALVSPPPCLLLLSRGRKRSLCFLRPFKRGVSRLHFFLPAFDRIGRVIDALNER